MLSLISLFAGGDIGAAFFNGLRLFQPKGPLVNSEYYPGWIDYWGYPHSTGTTKAVVHTMVRMLALPTVSVNFYVFHGGTNFGFMAGKSHANLLEYHIACKKNKSNNSFSM